MSDDRRRRITIWVIRARVSAVGFVPFTMIAVEHNVPQMKSSRPPTASYHRFCGGPSIGPCPKTETSPVLVLRVRSDNC